MLKNNPIVSVVISTYNRTHYLKITLDSVVNQTYTNIEIIVVDDGSIGNLNENLCSKYSNIKYFKIKNSGSPSKPRNIGASKSNGKYIAFLDDDDIWLPNKIELQIKILEDNLDFGLVHSCCNVIDEQGLETGEIVGRPGSPFVKHGNVLMNMLGNWTIMMPSPLIKKSILEEVGGFNEEMQHAGEDVEFWSRCAFHTKFYYIDEPLACYRRHSNNVTNNNSNIDLPKWLLKVINKKKKLEIISNETYKILKTNLVFMQAKMIKNNTLGTISNLFKLNPFWFLKIKVLKVILKKTIS